jgi:hypothetical protein
VTLASDRSAEYNQPMAAPEIPRDELAAAAEARRELGPEAERAVIDSFLARVEAEIDERVDRRVAERVRTQAYRGDGAPRGTIPLALGSMGLGIAVTGASSGLAEGGVFVAVVAWIAIAVINIVYIAR